MNRILIVIMAFICFSNPIHVWSEDTQDRELKVHFIDVGQGDSILIQTPSNKNILIDGGRPEAGKKVVQYLKEHKVSEVDLLIATHPDYDHIGGLAKVMKSISIKQILDTGKVHLTKSYANYINEVRRQEIPTIIAKKNQEVKLDPFIDIKILNAHQKNNSNNQSSIALKLTYNRVDFLLMSDVEMEQEKGFLKRKDIKAEVIKVAHHGSDTSTSLPFLKAVNPEVAILTYSRDNNFGHPVERVIENLDRVDAMIYSTAVFGDVVISSDGEDYYVLPEKSPYDNLKEKSA